MHRFAAVDIGSNSLLLTIIEGSSPQNFCILHDEAIVVGLAKGWAADKSIPSEKITKAREVLADYATKGQDYGVRYWAVAATEALRKASNGMQVKKDFESALGHSIDLISGEREAELSFSSVQKSYADAHRLKLVFDIGGASTELCLGNHNGIHSRVSLKMGSVVLTEQFSLTRPCSTEAVLHHCRSVIEKSSLSKDACKNAMGIGVAGTITTLFALDKELQSYRRDAVHGTSMTRETLRHWLQRLAALNATERAQYPGLPLDRADVIVGGLAIASALADFYEWPEITCLDLGVRFGLLFEMLEQNT